MALNPSYNVTVSVTGDSTSMVNEAMNGAGSTYQITDAARRLVDPSSAITIKEGGVATVKTFTFDYFTGTVTFVGTPTLAVTIDGNFLPVRQLTEAYEIDVSLSRNLSDTSRLGEDFTRRTAAIADITGSFSCYDDGNTVYGLDLDLNQVLVDGTTKVIKVALGDGTNILQFFALLETNEVSASVDSVQQLTVSFSANAQTALTTGQEVDFSWA